MWGVETPGQQPQYVALSHCRGPLGINFVTTKMNVDAMRKGIPLDMLTKTFQHAITATRRFADWHRFAIENRITSERAWCFQETLLAPRSLYFFKGQHCWVCRTTSASETLPNSVTLSYKHLSVRSKHSQDILSEWRNMIQDYTKRSSRIPKIICRDLRCRQSPP